MADYVKAHDYGAPPGSSGRPYMSQAKPGWGAPPPGAGYSYSRLPPGSYGPMQPYGPMYVQPHPVMGQGKQPNVRRM